MSQAEEKKTKAKAKVTAPTTVSKANSQEFKDWLDSIYDVSKVQDQDILSYYEAFRYHGFDRMEVLFNLYEVVQDKETAHQLIMLCAIQGPVRASIAKLLGGKTPIDLKIPASGVKGTSRISCQRVTAATADLAAYFLKKANFPKRLVHDCPAWLQFPSAGSITMPENVRLLHIDFSRKFSVLIGGVFNEQIYATMVANSYLDARLNLFAN